MIRLSGRDLDMLRPGSPRALAACRNLALRCPALRHGGITTALDEAALRVTISRGPRALVLTATRGGWRAAPDVPWLRFALGDTSALARRAAALLGAVPTAHMRAGELDAVTRQAEDAAAAAQDGDMETARRLLLI